MAVAAQVGATRRRPSRWPARLLAVAVALLVCGPALAPGFALLGDMVFVPRQDLDADALGLSGALPRAVPADAVLALLTAVIPGALVQKAVLLGAAFAAVLGAARLVPPDRGRRTAASGLVAGLVYGWSPYVAERLLIGHWTLVVAYAALPWVVRAGLRVRAGQPGGLPRLVVACAPAALSPTGALLAAGAALAVAGRRRVLPVALVQVGLALPWIVAGALHPGGSGSDPGGVAAFAARAENWAGTVAAVVGTGGIWNALAVPASRTTVLAPVVTLAVVALAVVGWAGRGTLRMPGARGLLVLGGLGLLLASAGAVPPGAALLGWVVEAVPGGGLLRDAQKWAAWWALPLALGAGLGARRLQERAGSEFGPAAARAVAVGLALLPVAALPDLAWGLGGRLAAVDYPADWARVRAVLADDPAPGDVLVLPFSAYRAFPWNAGRPQLDPAPRWLPRPVVVDDDLVVDRRTVAGEDSRARQVAAAATDPVRLAGLGVGWVLVERTTPGPPAPAAVDRLPLVVDGAELALHRVPGAVPGPSPGVTRTVAVAAAHAVALGLAGGSALWIIGRASTVTLRRRPLRKRAPA